MRLVLFNYGSSGLFHYACSILHALLEHTDHDILFFTSQFNNLDLLPVDKKLRVIAQPAPHNLANFLLWAANYKQQKVIRTELAAFKPDVIHILDEFPIYPLLYPILRHYPIVFTQHDPVSHTGERYQIFTKLLQKYLQSLSSKIVVHGEVLKKELVTHHPELSSKIAVIPLAAQSLLTKSSSSVQKIPRSILFFGRIVEYKGLGVLLEALLLLQQQNNNFHLTIAGPGSLEAYKDLLHQIKNKEILNYYIPDEKVNDYFQRSEIIVLPYREATQSSVATLALSAQVPIIASSVGSLPELLTDNYNSLLVPPADPAALAQAIAKLLGNTDLQAKLVKNGQQTISEKLSWAHIAELYSHVYDEAIL